MKKNIIALAAFIGWSGIVAVAWWSANARVELCQRDIWGHFSEPECGIRALAARDGILTTGLIVALVAAIIIALVWTRTIPSPSAWRRSSNPDSPTRLR